MKNITDSYISLGEGIFGGHMVQFLAWNRVDISLFQFLKALFDNSSCEDVFIYI